MILDHASGEQQTCFSVVLYSASVSALLILLCGAAALGAIGPDLWGGSVRFMGYTLHPLVLLYALSGSLMISRIRIPKL